MSNQLQLKCSESYTRDVGRGVARIDYATMDKLKLSTGDDILIKGKRRSVAKALPLYPSDEGKDMIRLDGLTRNNTKSEVGGLIVIEKIECKPAVTITVVPLEEIPPIDERYLSDALESVNVMVGDNVMIPYFGARITLQVSKTEPKGPVKISQKTEFTIQDKPEITIPDVVEIDAKIGKLIIKMLTSGYGLTEIQRTTGVERVALQEWLENIHNVGSRPLFIHCKSKECFPTHKYIQQDNIFYCHKLKIGRMVWD